MPWTAPKRLGEIDALAGTLTHMGFIEVRVEGDSVSFRVNAPDSHPQTLKAADLPWKLRAWLNQGMLRDGDIIKFLGEEK